MRILALSTGREAALLRQMMTHVLVIPYSDLAKHKVFVVGDREGIADELAPLKVEYREITEAEMEALREIYAVDARVERELARSALAIDNLLGKAPELDLPEEVWPLVPRLPYRSAEYASPKVWKPP